jgi:hypothetical protein
VDEDVDDVLSTFVIWKIHVFCVGYGNQGGVNESKVLEWI